MEGARAVMVSSAQHIPGGACAGRASACRAGPVTPETCASGIHGDEDLCKRMTGILRSKERRRSHRMNVGERIAGMLRLVLFRLGSPRSGQTVAAQCVSAGHASVVTYSHRMNVGERIAGMLRLILFRLVSPRSGRTVAAQCVRAGHASVVTYLAPQRGAGAGPGARGGSWGGVQAAGLFPARALSESGAI
jgi:hypothetical protein